MPVRQEAVGRSRVRPLGLGRWLYMGTSLGIQAYGVGMRGCCDTKVDPRSFVLVPV